MKARYLAAGQGSAAAQFQKIIDPGRYDRQSSLPRLTPVIPEA